MDKYFTDKSSHEHTDTSDIHDQLSPQYTNHRHDMYERIRKDVDHLDIMTHPDIELDGENSESVEDLVQCWMAGDSEG